MKNQRRWKTSTLCPKLPDAAGEPVPFSPCNTDGMKPDDVKKHAAFQPGSIIYVPYRGLARKAVVLRIFAEYRERLVEWIPKYRVAFAVERLTFPDRKKVLEWSEAWEFTYIGYIQRAYLLAEDGKVWKPKDPPKLPKIKLVEWSK